MAIGKNKKLSKGKKGLKKKIGDPFAKKEWYTVMAPSMFAVRDAGRTVINKTAGQRIASEELKGRICEVNLADLNNDEEFAYRKVKLEILDVQGRNCLTDFYSMDMSRDKVCSLIRKWQTLIEANVDVRTQDGYTLRVFVIGFTKRQSNSNKDNCYAGAAQVRRIRKRMVDLITKEASSNSLRDFVKRVLANAVSNDLEKATRGIYPLKDIYVRKVKMVKKPAFDLTRLMELHSASGDASAEGVQVDRNVIPESEAAKNPLTAAVEASATQKKAAPAPAKKA